jgi:putative ABC transport system permease protein
MLTAANLRKHKGQAASLLLFVIIAAMFLDIGLVIFTGAGNFFEKRAEELNAEHFTALELNEALIADELNYLENYPGVTETEALTVVGGFGNTYIGGTESHAYIFIAPASDSQKMNPCRTIGEALPLTGEGIYIPYCLFLSGGYKQGDDFKLSLSGEELKFTVAGATEEIKYGAAMNQLYRFYVSDAKYNELRQNLPDARLYLVSARLEDASDAVFLEDEFNREYQSETMLLSFGISSAAQARTLIPMIAAVFVILFAIILLVVSLIVIRFRIVSSILGNMTNIGAQKAVGFRSVQIILSIALQFGIISAAGCVIGVSLAQPAIPAITRVMEPVYALVWEPRFDPLSAFISFLAVMFMVILVSFLSARGINKLHP